VNTYLPVSCPKVPVVARAVMMYDPEGAQVGVTSPFFLQFGDLPSSTIASKSSTITIPRNDVPNFMIVMNPCCFAPPSTLPSVLSVYRPFPSLDPCLTLVPFFFPHLPHFLLLSFLVLLLVSQLCCYFSLPRLFGATLCIGPSHRNTEPRLHGVDPLGLTCPRRGIYVCVVCVLCYFIPCLVTI